MLVLTRKVDEKLVIPGVNTEIILVETRPGKVRLGVIAPKNVGVYREELMSELPAEKIQQGRFLLAEREAHRLRNLLNSGTVGLGLIRRLIQSGSDSATLLRTLERVAKGMSIEAAVAVEGKKTCYALLVEDNANERELLAGMLEMAGIRVAAVEDGDDALLYLKRHEQKPDVILLDMNMPRMNGVDLAHTVRDQFPDAKTKIFMVTGAEPPARVPPVDRWIRKPVNPDNLLRELNNISC